MNNTQLHGLRVLNTRPHDQAHTLSQAIQNAGGVAIELPAIAIEATANDWLENLPPFANISRAIFISTNAVNYFYTKLQRHRIPWPANIQTIAIGKATANALDQWNRSQYLCPEVADSEHLLQLDTFQRIEGHSILLVKGIGGRKEIEETLRARGANLHIASVYQRTLPKVDLAYLGSLWQHDQVDIILFTSQQAMHNVFTLLGEAAHTWLRNKPCLVISNRLATEAHTLGIKNVIISQHDTILTTLGKYTQGTTHDQQR